MNALCNVLSGRQIPPMVERNWVVNPQEKMIDIYTAAHKLGLSISLVAEAVERGYIKHLKTTDGKAMFCRKHISLLRIKHRLGINILKTRVA